MKRQQEVWKGRRSLIRVGTLNIGTMTGRGRELADLMEQTNVDILCLQETKWKRSKARNIGGGCKLFYNGADGKKWDRDSGEGGAGRKCPGGEKDVRQTNGHEARGKRVHPKYSKCVCSTN